jgi:Tfp pilus assembly protein PilN
MLNFFRNIEFLQSKRVTGLHCTLNGSNAPTFSSILLRKKKSKIEFENSIEFQCEIEKLPENIDINYPVCLSIDGKGILNKQITIDPAKTILQQTIPNASENDFIVEKFNGSDNTLFISLARKDLVDEILKKLSDQKIQVIGLTIGTFSLIGLFEMFADLPTSILSGLYEIEVNKANLEIISFRKSELGNTEIRQYNLDQNPILSSFLLPFNNAFAYYSNQSLNFEYQKITTQKEEYLSKRVFVTIGWGILIFIFLGLLVNYFVFNDLSEKKLQLENQVSGNRDMVLKLKILRDEISWREKYLGQAGTDRSKWFSYIADQIAASVPEEILLEKFDLHPLNSKIRNLKEIELQPDIILIDGLTKSSASVNEWAVNLNKLAGISDVVVENFSQPDNSSGFFSIKITLSSNTN